MTRDIQRFRITRDDVRAARDALTTHALKARYARLQCAMTVTPVVVNGIALGVDHMQSVVRAMPANFFSGKDVAIFMGSMICSSAVNIYVARNALEPLNKANAIANGNIKDPFSEKAVVALLGPKNLIFLMRGLNAINSFSTSLALSAASASQKICVYGIDGLYVNRPVMAGALALLATVAAVHQIHWGFFVRRAF